ncbi:U3 small nucleolar RNA-associated protein 6 [Nymphon striatum]|nr:U3 small nucleolar RNA-associated protein 6 [Nymphon striatum]
MAEVVELNIERTIPVLQQLERVNLFKKDEIKSIIKHRKALEYLLKRSTKSKADFKKYIQYEINLLGLLKLRRAKIGYQFKKVEIDNVHIQGINRLFKMAVFLFQNDIDLWIAHISFLKKIHWTGSISKMYARMLQVHSKVPEVWIDASKWEFESNSSPENARSLMQRSLRFNVKSEKLWLEYFKLELMFAEKMKNRLEILGVEEKQKKEADEIDDEILDGKIAIIIFKNAIKEITNIAFKTQFLQIACRFKFTNMVEDEIYKSIEEDHIGMEEGLDILARRSLLRINEIKSTKGVKKSIVKRTYELERIAFQSYDSALIKINSEKMWSLYIQFCVERLSASGTEKHAVLILSHVLELFSQASNKNKLLPNDLMIWIHLLEECNEENQLRKVIEIAISAYPTDVHIWMKYLELCIHSDKDKEEIFELFQKAIKVVETKEAVSIWKLFSNWAIDSKSTPETVSSILEEAITTCRGESVYFQFLYLDWSIAHGDFSAANKTFEWIKKHSRLTPELISKITSLEKNQKNSQIKELRSYYEAGAHEFGSTNIQIWLDYISTENNHKDGNKIASGKIYWRAIKRLEPQLTDKFVASYTTSWKKV